MVAEAVASPKRRDWRKGIVAARRSGVWTGRAGKRVAVGAGDWTKVS